MDMRYGISGGGGYISRQGGGGAGGDCFGRYGGGGFGLYDISMVDRMMLKFRPIAPKPVASSGSGSGGSTVDNGGGNTRVKRKYVRVDNNNKDKGSKRNSKDGKKRKMAKSPEKVSSGGDTVVTLSLMPETTDRKEKLPGDCCSSEKLWLGFEKDCHEKSREGHVTVKQREQTVLFLVVEMVKEVKVDCGLVRWTEVEMERDTCPSFVTDGRDRVVWMNNTCREYMMDVGDEVVVMVVRNIGELPVAFMCNVRVTCKNGIRFSSVTVPCDAWRMTGGGGGYGWRLDIKAALSLGR